MHQRVVPHFGLKSSIGKAMTAPGTALTVYKRHANSPDAGAVDLTFASASPRTLTANVRSKRTGKTMFAGVHFWLSHS
jgi:hypothetical protein